MAEEQKGLSAREVQERIDAGKINTSTGSISRTKGEIVRSHLFTYFNFLNLFLGGLVLITGQFKNMLFLGTIVCNSIIGIVQELRVKSLVDKLSVITASKARVIRDGEQSEIPLDEIVMDDVIRLESGDQVGADCTLISGQGVEVNESMITGESVSVKKHAGDEMLSGSFLTAGSGLARVIHVGADNYATELASKARHKKRASSEMQRSINRIIKAVGVIIIPVGIMLYLSQRSVSGASWDDAIVNTVAGVTGMIPEGLVLLTSVSFIVGVGKLALKHALVQEMEAIESLARVNVLCCDKTGTITTGELEVQEIVSLDGTPESELSHIMSELVYAFDDVNPTQQALLDHFPKTGEWQAQEIIPFSSARKYRAASFGENGSWVLGAPEFILGDDEQLMERCNTCAGEGLRVLLLAKTQGISAEQENIGSPVPVALILISDVVREDAPETFRFFRSQGVAIKIISGDNPATVAQIARKAGFSGSERYIDAQTLPEDDAELERMVERYNIFGRVTPEQKQRLIRAYQANGDVVGMVGDGVNDVLALKDADCGIAMAAGSDAAKQVAHIVLLDSNFAHLQDIVKEGRSIIANIERVSALYLTKTIYSSLLCVIFILLSKSYPFVPMHLTLVSALAIGAPSFFLALEPNDEVTSGGFLRHVLRVSLPGALTMVIGVLANTFMTDFLRVDSGMTSTFNFLILGFVSMMVLYVVSSPMNKLRRALCYTMCMMLLIAMIGWPEFFSIDRIFDWRLILVVPVLILCYFSMKYLRRAARVVFRSRDSVRKKRRKVQENPS